jgi:hypothetical protein
MDSANDHGPLTTIALLATAEVQEFLEGIRLSFQPDDAELAETIHEELYHTLVLLTTPQTWENAQQGFMKMALAATTYAQRARLDLHSMQLASGLPGPKKRTTPLPKPRKEAEASPALPGPPTTQEAPSSATSPE